MPSEFICQAARIGSRLKSFIYWYLNSKLVAKLDVISYSAPRPMLNANLSLLYDQSEVGEFHIAVAKSGQRIEIEPIGARNHEMHVGHSRETAHTLVAESEINIRLQANKACGLILEFSIKNEIGH